jgi:TonB dependent receptor-like, beta-barrel/CarboxypepD_reg-like domain
LAPVTNEKSQTELPDINTVIFVSLCKTFNRIVDIMNFNSVINCLFYLFLLSSISLAQTSNKNSKQFPKELNNIISLDITNDSFEEALENISKQIDVKFNYNRNRIPLQKIINVVIENESALNILHYILNLTTTEIRIISGDQLLIVPSDFNKILKGRIIGKVIDAKTKRSLIGANVLVEGYNFGAATNIDGSVSIDNLPIGSYSIKISYIGFLPITLTDIIVKADKATFFDAELISQTIISKEVIVSSDYFSLPSQHTTSSSKFSYEEMRRSATLGGDITRIINSLPSLSNENEANHIVARGGSTIENAFFVDNIQIPTINHFSFSGTTGGLFSILNLDFVNNINVYTGGFASKFGDRVSSVVDINYREGNREEFEAQFDFNFGGISAQLEGPLKNNSGSWMISAKHSFSDIILDIMDELEQPSKFDDIQGKITFNINSNNKLSIINILSIDDWLTPRKYSLDNFWNWFGTFKQLQNVIGVSWKYLWGEKGFSNTSLSHIYQNEETSLFFTTSESSKLNLNIRNNYYQFRNINSFEWLSEHYFEFGLETKFITNKSDNFFAEQINLFGTPKPELKINDKLSEFKFAAFFSDEWSPIASLTLIPGLRINYFTYNRNIDFSPRLSTIYKLNEKLSLTGSLGIYYQNLPMHFLSQNKNFSSLKSIKSMHTVLGFNWLISDDTKVTIELYNKDYSNTPVDTELPSVYLLDEAIYNVFYSDHFNLANSGNANTRGIELMIQKKLTNNFYGSISFTYFRSSYKNKNDIWRDRVIDNKYLASVEGGYKFNNEWEVSLRWNYAGGMAYTPFNNTLSQLYGFGVYDKNKINSERVPDYFSTSIRVDKRFHFKDFNLITYISVWNFFDRENVSIHGWSESYNLEVDYKLMSSVPVIGVEMEF